MLLCRNSSLWNAIFLKEITLKIRTLFLAKYIMESPEKKTPILDKRITAYLENLIAFL